MSFFPLDASLALYVAVGVIGVFVALVLIGILVTIMAPLPTTGTPKVLPNGMKISSWTDFETNFLFEEIWGNDSAYANGGIQFREGATIIDCGANIGMFTLYAASRCRGNATILSFEPIRSTYEVLRTNAINANNGNYDSVFNARQNANLNIIPLNCGVSNKKMDVTFEHHPALSIWSTSDSTLAAERVERIVDDLTTACAFSPNFLVRLIPSFFVRFVARTLFAKRFAITQKVNARLVRLSDMIERYLPADGPIDLLKVDVEGAEVQCLEGIDADHWERIEQVVLEVENFEAVRRVTAILTKNGFNVEAVASETEKNPNGRSEVSMVYAIKPKSKIAKSRKSSVRNVKEVEEPASDSDSTTTVGSHSSSDDFDLEDFDIDSDEEIISIPVNKKTSPVKASPVKKMATPSSVARKSVTASPAQKSSPKTSKSISSAIEESKKLMEERAHARIAQLQAGTSSTKKRAASRSRS